MKVKHKKVILGLLACLFLFVLASCGTDKENDDQNNEPNNANTEGNNNENENDSENTDGANNTNNEENNNSNTGNVQDELEEIDYSKDTNPVVTLTMEDGGEITIELYPEVAPNTVANFISLIEEGFYDGLIFHRVIPNFMIQGGDPEGTGFGGPGYGIPGEFNDNGFKNDLTHNRGVISMARSGHPDSAGSQFFIVVKDSPGLDDEYAGFGKVLTGMEVADQIVSVDTKSDKPLEDQRIQTMTVDTKGIDYEEPETIK